MNMETTLYDLICAYDFVDLEEVFVKLYNEDYIRNSVGYESVFELLKEIDDSTKLSDYLIHIREGEENKKKRPWHFVSGKRVEDDLYSDLSLTSWEEWLGMRISPETLLNHSGREIICYCLWEMTFYGYDEKQIDKKRKSLENEYSRNIESLMDELEDIDDDEEGKKILKELLKYEIESSSSEDDFYQD